MTRYSKTLVALVPFLVAALKVLSDALGDGTVSGQEWLAVAVTLAGAVGVFAVPNVAPRGQAPDPTKSEVGPGA